uniref:Uncharacterized protein n=1 Tax=Chromera velia CCMP2878 TaxID=1169474 RepID=A0A0G4HU17_9ALVE|eukprot:Cvel_31676.t1-p1 / transcript=Cvel_31676.t1 / gene=Cvel_31676 / organism=Chromera_velia_CCMP2878 / gene_product=hypothetical protein / transcript_product=hypothetical protein / location=Cvel_scaffold4764:5519-7181(-) / protein_length=230 / sequence_SO=supercontig / SO=protein_coding / is_pseudo=false
MASPLLDSISTREHGETVNLYDNGLSRGTATDKATAARIGGTKYNILVNSVKEHYFPNLRRGDEGTQWKKPFWQSRRKTGNGAESSRMAGSLRLNVQQFPTATMKKRNEGQMALPLYTATPVTLHGNAYRPGDVSNTQHVSRKDYLEMRRQVVSRWGDRSSLSPWTATADQIVSSQANRKLDNADFSVTRGNNHYSQQCKLTRTDPYYGPPNYTHVSAPSRQYDMFSNLR